LVIQTAARHAGREGRSKTIELRSQRDARGAPGSAVLEGTVLSAWTFPGGDCSIVVDGNRFVIAETAKTKSLDELRRLLRDEAP